MSRAFFILIATLPFLACGDPHLGSLLGAQITSAELNIAIDNISLVGGHVLGEGSVVVTHLDGLQEGEAVIIEGLQRVRPGVPVEAIVAAEGEE